MANPKKVTLLLKRGLKKDLPTLAPGEAGFATDTKEFFVGSETGNIPLASTDQVQFVEDKVTGVETSLGNKADKTEVTTLTAQLADKAQKSYVDSELTKKANDLDVRKKSVKLMPEDLSSETLGLVTGTGTVNLLSIPQISSVSQEKTDFVKMGKNLFDLESCVLGALSTSTGQPSANATFLLTPFIPVTPGKTIYVSSDANSQGSQMLARLIYRLGYYDTNKNFLGMVAPSSNLGMEYALNSSATHASVIKIPDNAIYIRFIVPEANKKDKIQVEYDQVSSYETFRYVIPKLSLSSSNNKEVINKEEIDCWGDSLSDGSGASSSANNYPAKLQSFLGDKFKVQNCGIGGEPALSIAMRQGAVPIYVNPVTIPDGATPVTVTLRNRYTKTNVSLFRRGGSYVDPYYNNLRINPVVINGIEGTLSRPDVSKFEYTFTRTTAGESVTIQRPTLVNTFANRNQRNRTSIIWIGTNDTTKSVEYIMQVQQNIVDNLTHDNYIILGLTAKSYHADVANKNAIMSERWGKRFLDIRDYLLEYGLIDAGITPTSQDNTDVANGEVPVSLRVDDVHFNDAGYNVIASQVYKKGKELGYWA